jgi:UDP:flavonoid glycosyltransferase YjiC (YdhE family)
VTETDELRNKVEELMKKIEKLETHTTTTMTTNSHNVNSNNTNININYNMVSFGREDLHLLNASEKNRIINGGTNAIPLHVRYVHFNDRLPQNMNIYKTNLRDNTVDIYDGAKYIKANCKQMIDTLIDSGMIDIESLLEGEYKNEHGYMVLKTKETLELLKNNHKDTVKEQTDRVTRILYNEKDKPIKRRGKCEP